MEAGRRDHLDRLASPPFSTRFTLGALVTFMVTVADITVLNIGAAFWGLVAGIVVSWLLERPDFSAAEDD